MVTSLMELLTSRKKDMSKMFSEVQKSVFFSFSIHVDGFCTWSVFWEAGGGPTLHEQKKILKETTK